MAEFEDDEIAWLEKQAARPKKELEEEAIAEIKKKNSDLKVQLKAARAGKRQVESSL